MKLQMDKLPRTVQIGFEKGSAPVFVYIDQRKLPQELVQECTSDWHQVVDAIKTLAVRGAPAIGVAGAAAIALSVYEHRDLTVQGCVASVMSDGIEISEARPTAVNLMWAVDRMEDLLMDASMEAKTTAELLNVAVAEVKAIIDLDERCNRAMGKAGAELIKPGSKILTHCNAGSLATAFYGTALGVIYAAAEQGKVEHVYADETRPLGQGSRLTVWELAQAGVPVTLICDNMAASLMRSGEVDAVIVGADRIAANGDVANKIGTYGVAVLAKHHGIPMYVAAPFSTIDPSTLSGEDVVIEQRAVSEVSACIPEGVEVWNPAFDVTPADLITAIITERGVFAPKDILKACE